MNLKEYVLTYRNENNEIVVSIADYYERFIKPLNPAFKDCSFYTSKLVLCCFHDDVNPSLGTINHKFYKGVRIYHCFGCGASGDVIRLHQRIQSQYYNRKITDTESALELCKLYGLDTSRFEQQIDLGDQAKFMERIQKVGDMLDRYSLQEFSEELRGIRLDNTLSLDQRVNKINSSLVKYIATSKNMYE